MLNISLNVNNVVNVVASLPFAHVAHSVTRAGRNYDWGKENERRGLDFATADGFNQLDEHEGLWLVGVVVVAAVDEF